MLSNLDGDYIFRGLHWISQRASLETAVLQLSFALKETIKLQLSYIENIILRMALLIRES